MNLPSVRGLFAHYVDYHRHGPLMFRYVSVLGFTAIPLFYLLRFTKADPGYDDWWIRAIFAVLSVAAFLQHRWPDQLKPFYYLYSYVLLIIGMPGTLTFLSLHHGGGPIAVGNTMMAAAFIMLLADWRNMIVIMLSGMALGTLIYVATATSPQMPADYIARLPILLVTLLGGSLIKHALESATAERVHQAYASLAGSIAHEMRHPLGQLKHSLEGIQQELPTPTTRTHLQALMTERLDEIYRHVAQGELAVQRGLQVISMTLEEVHARPMKPEGFTFLRAGESCAKAMQEYGYEDATHRANVTLRVDCDFVFRADETAFLFVLFNLIRNALANPGVQVLMVVSAGRVEVHDNGPGMSPDVQAHLFKPFHSQGKVGGTGLGLAYCWRVMKAFGGTIECSSVPGKSTCFSLVLPSVTLAEREMERVATLARARALFDGRRILVVDDEAAVRFLTRHKLASIGAVVDECADAEKALQMLAQQRYDLIVLDLNLPGLDGYALAKRVRAGEAGMDRKICIVAHSSEPSAVTRIKTRKSTMDGFVAKPSAQGVLLQALCQAMEASLERDAEQHSPSPAGRVVLLADDNACIRKTVATSLRHSGFGVVEAGNGHQVLSMLATMDRCDVILLDIEMPGMNGLEAARAIRASALPCRQAPILMLSAHAGPRVLEEARRAGVDDFLTKPFNMAALEAKLRALPMNSPPISYELEENNQMETGMDSLLDKTRIDNYRRIGVLEELVVDYLPAIDGLLASVESAAKAKDAKTCCEALHSLLGMSGEVGAIALYRFVRKCYTPLVDEGRWPEHDDWTASLRTLVERTRQALGKSVMPAMRV
jgi:two-component system CAI-1 autoinducer sensor kinase/phosphatase CqsS